MGALLAQRQQYKPAIEALHKAIELQPNSGWAHFAMGVCLVKTGDFKTAAVHLELATARLPEFSTVHRYLAESYEKLGKTKEAQAERAKIAPSPKAK
jgi:predicted Zn-dependent protease